MWNTLADIHQYQTEGQFVNAGFQKYSTESDIVKEEWNNEETGDAV